MRQRTCAGLGLLVALMLAVLPAIGGVRPAAAASAQGGLGLIDERNYESPQFGYTVSWGDDWSARARDVTSNRGGFDTLTLRSDGGTLRIAGQSDEANAADVVARRIEIESDSPDDVVTENLDAEVPSAELLVRRTRVLIEAYTLPDNGAVVVVVLSARDTRFEDTLASAQDQVLLNDSPLLTGQPIGGGVATEAATEAPTEEATETPTEEATAEPTEEPVNLIPNETETPTEEVATVEPTTVVVTEETPTAEATEEGTTEPTVTSTGSGIEGNTFTSTLYGYSFEWDEDLWEVSDEFLSDTSDGVFLSTDTGNLTIWAWDAYGSDPVACLDGEADYYATQDPTVSDWAPAEDSNGDPLRGEGDDYAYGVFRLTYTAEDENAEPVDLVDYIECRSMPDQDAVVIIFGSSTPEDYNDHLDALLDVADTIEFGAAVVPSETPEETETPEVTPEETETPEVTETPEGTPVDVTGETGLDGSTFTSPSFGFSLEIPAEWSVVDESITPGEESLMLTDGVSDVTLRATDAYSGDLDGCIGFVIRDVSLQDLELDVTAEGDPFRGSDANGAYANFVYTGDDGAKQAFFVSCRYIEEGQSVLILTQDVPYDSFTSERQLRRELQDAIVLP